MASRLLRSFAIFATAAGLRKIKRAGTSCSQSDNMACAGSECYTCGERIAYLESQGMSREAAGQQIAAEFPQDCGECGAGPCESWCEADYYGGNNAGRHCSPGDMAYLCGGCSFCGAPSPGPSPVPVPPSPPSSGNGIVVSGRQLLINGVPFHMKGICWNPIAKGKVHPQDLDFTGFVDQDSLIMEEAGINVVRPYEPITDRSVLDTFWQRGIYVVNSAYSWGGAPAQSAADVVNAVKDHPAILMWAVGNEWNYNQLYFGLSFDEARARVAEVVDVIKRNDPAHPVSTIYGELPDDNTLNILRQVDVWGINAYRGIGFNGLFDQWRSRSSKPMYLGEYGADAYDARINSPNYGAQEEATRALTNEIVANSAVTGGVCVGGMIFEFADEWWKDRSGSPWVHDAGGIAPGAGPHPDRTFNEEWWGLLDIDRSPRSAWEAYKAVRIPG